jgi:predicted RNase H-like HicB family nuclease/DNA-binding XRE family transcriptional regulator
MIKYQAKIFKDEERYSVIFPDLPGCFSDGGTLEEAKENAREALSLYLEEARDPKWEVPKAKSRRGKQYFWIVPFEDVAIPLMIRHARLKHGISQRVLAKKLGMTVQQLQKLEMPGMSNPTIKTLVQISAALDEQLEIRLAS